MCRSTATRTVTVANPEGLHARAATLIADVVRRSETEVRVAKGSDRVDAIDVLQVLSLGAQEGDQLVLEASGQHAEKVLEELAQLFADRFGEEQPKTEQK